MPLDPDETTELHAAAQYLNSAHQQLDTARQRLGALLGGPHPSATVEDKIDIYQKTYAEVSNYDRHYSTVRSALTTLVVGAGLVAAGEPLKTPITSSLCAICTDDRWCSVKSVIISVTAPFALTWLLFLLAILVSLNFQRLTYACRKLEEEIERRVASIAGLKPFQDQAVEGASVDGFRFRSDFRAVAKKVRFWYFDEMSQLLLAAISAFLLLLFLNATRLCVPNFFSKWWIELFLIAAVVVFLVVALAWGINKIQQFRGPRRT